MSLLIWLPLHGNLENYGSSPIKFSLNTTGGGVAAATSGGKTDMRCYQRTAINTVSHITSDSTIDLNKDFTMACWCYPTTPGNATSANGILTNHNHSHNSDKGSGSGITLKYSGNTTCYMSCNTSSSTGRTYYSYYGTTNIYGAWHHLCLTYKKSTKTYRLFVDGICEKEFTCENVSAANKFNIFDWSVGHSNNGSYRPACKINDVRVYDECLSKREVKLLSQGLVLHYKLDGGNANNLLTNSYTIGNRQTSFDKVYGFPVCSADNSAGTGYKDFASWGGHSVSINEVYTASFFAKSSTSSTLTMYFYNNTSGVVQVSNIKSSEGHNKSGSDGNCPLSLTPQWKKYTVTWTFAASGTTTNKTLLFRLAAGGKCDIALPKLEKGSIATPYCPALSETFFNAADDCSGYGRNGTTVGNITFSSDTPRYAASSVFDGSTTGINLPIKDLMKAVLSDKCTINFWVKESNTSSRSIYFGGYSGSNFNIEQNVTSFRVYWNGSPDLSVGTITNNEWAMWTVTTDIATGIKIYKNATLVKTHTGALTNIASSFTRDFNIGKDSRTDDTMMEGKMSDFRIYASVLSATDIKDLYQTAASITKEGSVQAYEFIEEPDSFDIKMTKQGMLKAADISEIGYIGGMKVKVLSDNSAWARIHWLDVTTDKTWFTASEVAFCNQANRFSRMGLVDHFKVDGKYEFMLTYPSLSNSLYNRWTQTSSPNASTVTGFTAITTAWNNHNAGIRKHGSACVYNCDTGSTWFAPIGQKSAWDSTKFIPAADGTSQTETELWVRIDTLPNLTKTSMLDKEYLQAFKIYEI